MLYRSVRVFTKTFRADLAISFNVKFHIHENKAFHNHNSKPALLST